MSYTAILSFRPEKSYSMVKNMMKIGVLSDTHLFADRGWLNTVKQVARNTRTLDDLHTLLLNDFQNVDRLIHAGDFVHMEVLEMLREIAPIEAVWGNMDPGSLREILPETTIFEVEGIRIGVTHGDGAPKGIIERVQQRFQHETVDTIIFGHTHRPLNERYHGILFFNPGSPTDRIFAPYNSIGLLEIDNRTIAGKIIRI